MPSYICTTCGVGYAETEAPRDVCLICADERQYVNAKGQSWTTLEDLQADHVNELREVEPGLTGLGSKPQVAIGQRALIIERPDGGIMWDCTPVISDEAHASALLATLHRTGVKVWLDDFGTGFSGLSHLRRVPVDGVKIDRSFIADMLRDPDDLALTTAIIAMAHSLGITVVAEGVEKEGQFNLLRERGCDLAQGYWLGYPVTAAEFAQLVA